MANKRNPAVRYVVYDESGAILKSGTCPLDCVSMQARQGEYVMQVDAAQAIDDRFQEVNRGRLREVPGMHERLVNLGNQLDAEEASRLQRLSNGDIDAANTLDELKAVLKVKLGE